MPPPSNGDIQASNTSCRTTSHTGYVRMPRATRSLAELSDSTNERDKALARGDATAAQVTHYRNQLCENGDSSSSTLDVTQCTSHSNSNSTVRLASLAIEDRQEPSLNTWTIKFLCFLDPQHHTHHSHSLQSRHAMGAPPWSPRDQRLPFLSSPRCRHAQQPSVRCLLTTESSRGAGTSPRYRHTRWRSACSTETNCHSANRWSSSHSFGCSEARCCQRLPWVDAVAQPAQ